MSYRPPFWSVLHFPDHASLRILPFELRSLRQASSLLHKALNFLYYKKKTGVNKSPFDRVLIALFSSLPYVVTLRFSLRNAASLGASRKEVFQPHLPVRLPCYDLAPVTGITLKRSCDGHALQVPPTPMA